MAFSCQSGDLIDNDCCSKIRFLSCILQGNQYPSLAKAIEKKTENKHVRKNNKSNTGKTPVLVISRN